MGQKSKKLKRKAERKLLRQQWHSSLTEVASPPPATELPNQVAIESNIDELHEEHIRQGSFRLIFGTYNYNQCELVKMVKTSQAKSLIKLFGRITKLNITSLPSSGLIRGNIQKSGAYIGLFDTVPPDSELKEIQFAGTGRLYFYLFKDAFCVVAIQVRHR